MTDQRIQQDAICYQWFKQRLILNVSKPSISQGHRLKRTPSNRLCLSLRYHALNMRLVEMHAPTSRRRGTQLCVWRPDGPCAVSYHSTTRLGYQITVIFTYLIYSPSATADKWINWSVQLEADRRARSNRTRTRTNLGLNETDITRTRCREWVITWFTQTLPTATRIQQFNWNTI